MYWRSTYKCTHRLKPDSRRKYYWTILPTLRYRLGVGGVWSSLQEQWMVFPELLTHNPIKYCFYILLFVSVVTKDKDDGGLLRLFLCTSSRPYCCCGTWFSDSTFGSKGYRWWLIDKLKPVQWIGTLRTHNVDISSLLTNERGSQRTWNLQ